VSLGDDTVGEVEVDGGGLAGGDRKSSGGGARSRRRSRYLVRARGGEVHQRRIGAETGAAFSPQNSVESLAEVGATAPVGRHRRAPGRGPGYLSLAIRAGPTQGGQPRYAGRETESDARDGLDGRPEHFSDNVGSHQREVNAPLELGLQYLILTIRTSWLVG
jgi:hypothetical protein